MNKSYKSDALVLAIVLLLSFGVSKADLVDETSSEKDAEIDTIIVTATRLERDLSSVPASISVVTGEEIQSARQQLGLDEALAVVPGVFFQNRFNFAQDLRISIRGFGARSNFGVRGIKILIDDIPETLADGQSQVDSIDLASIGQVEVLRGPASAMYGNASGGVINISSEEIGPDPYVEARVATGEFGYQKNQIKTAGEVGRFDYLLSLSDMRIDGYREHSEAENTQLNSRFRFRPDSRSEFSLTFNATDQPVSNDAGGVTLADATANPRAARPQNVLFDSGEELDQQKLGISYTRSTDNGGTFLVRNYYLQRNFANRLPFTNGGIVKFDRFFAGGGASYTQAYQLGDIRHRLIVGVDYDRQDDDRSRFDNNMGIQGALTLEQQERVTSTGVFMQDEITLSERLAATIGIRYDNVDFNVTDTFLDDGDDSGSQSIDDISPSLGFVYAATENVDLFASLATAFETPTSTEFADPSGGGGFNPDLGPQKSTSFELGLRGVFNDRARYEVVIFDIDVDDELIPFEIASSPGRDFYVNAGKSSRRGLELAVSAEFVPGLSVSLSYTYSKFEFDEFLDENGNDYSGNVIPGIPRSFAFAEISYDHESGFFAAMDARYADDLFANNANTATVEGSTIANLRFGFRKIFEKMQIEPFIGVNNIANESYTANTRINAFGGRFYEPGPERNVYGGISFSHRF